MVTSGKSFITIAQLEKYSGRSGARFGPVGGHVVLSDPKRDRVRQQNFRVNRLVIALEQDLVRFGRL